nr:hypothetical protein [Tanacetum cinerariifolium]
PGLVLTVLHWTTSIEQPVEQFEQAALSPLRPAASARLGAATARYDGWPTAAAVAGRAGPAAQPRLHGASQLGSYSARVFSASRIVPAASTAPGSFYGGHAGDEGLSRECRGLLPASELAALFGESLCLLHPSYVDNSPNSVCEAQVAGLPVVATDVGGVRSLIEDEATGLLCTRSPATIARQALRLYQDPALRERLAVQATAVARQRHDPTVIVARTLATYQAVLADFRKA